MICQQSNHRRRYHRSLLFIICLSNHYIFHRGPIGEGDDCLVNEDARLNDDVVGRPIVEPLSPLFFLGPNL